MISLSEKEAYLLLKKLTINEKIIESYCGDYIFKNYIVTISNTYNGKTGFIRRTYSFKIYHVDDNNCKTELFSRSFGKEPKKRKTYLEVFLIGLYLGLCKREEYNHIKEKEDRHSKCVSEAIRYIGE